MNKLLKLQLRNIFHNKLFYICLGISLLLNVVVAYTASLLIKSLSPSAATTAMQGAVGIITGGVDIVGMIFITLVCTFDFTEGTTKNIIARGYSKVQLLFSKYIASLIGMLAIILISAIISFILYAKNGIGFESVMGLQLVVAIFSILAYTVFYGTLAFVLEKNSSAIIANMFAPQIVMLLFSVADSNLKTNMSKYWIGNVADTFTKKPTVANMGFPIIMYTAYIALFIVIGIYLTKRKEIK